MIRRLIESGEIKLSQRNIAVQSAVESYSDNPARLEMELRALGCSESETGYFLKMAKSISCITCGDGNGR